MDFDLRFLDPDSRTFLQHAIDGVNRAAFLHDPGAWNFVSAGHLIQANRCRGLKKAGEMDPIAATIFNEMEQDGHSSYSASWTVSTVTLVAKNYRAWRNDILLGSLIGINEDLNNFIKRRFTEKFPGEEGLDWLVKKEKVLHEIEYSYLAQHVLSDQDRNILQYLLKMENISHLGNEVLLEQIEAQLELLYPEVPKLSLPPLGS